MQNCPACGATVTHWRSVPSAEPVSREQRFELRRCVSCGSAVTVGAAGAELHDTGAYRPGQPRLYWLARPVLHRFDCRRLELVRELCPPPAKLLDAGAGRGRFVVAANAAGYDAFGIDPSRRGVEAAQAVGAPVQQASLETGQIPDCELDVITLWHVLEHLDDPPAALARVRQWLKPAGALLIGVPNLASLQARIADGRWYHLDVPRHRVHFTIDGIHALLRRSGFNVIRTEHTLLEHNPFGMWQSLVSCFTTQPSYLYNLLKRNAPLRSPDLLITLAAVPLAPIAAALEWAAAKAGRGGTVAILARPSD